MSNSLITGGLQTEFGGGVNGDCVIIQINHDKSTLDGLLAQQVQAQVSKQPRQVYEIGTIKHYLIEARPSGSGTISHLIGPNSKTLFDKLTNFANVCSKTDLTMGVGSDCACTDNSGGGGTGGLFSSMASAVSNWLSGGGGGGGTVTFKDGILNSIQLSATANDFVITSNIGFMFFDVVRD